MVTALADGIWWIELGGVNAYLLDESIATEGAASGVTLIDAGMPWHGDDLRDAIAGAGYELADLDRILLTHYDFDHVGALSTLDDAGATIYVGEGDVAFVTGDERPPWTNHKGLFQRALGGFVTPPHDLVETVADGDTVGSFTVYETPGHTPGHVAYVSAAASVGILGDLVRESRGSLTPSPWVISYDTDAVETSITDLAERAPGFEVLGIGHGRPFQRGGRDRLDRLAATV